MSMVEKVEGEGDYFWTAHGVVIILRKANNRLEVLHFISG